jgi:hypothetical protein
MVWACQQGSNMFCCCHVRQCLSANCLLGSLKHISSPQAKVSHSATSSHSQANPLTTVSTLDVTRHQWPPPPTVDCIFASEFSNTLRLRPSKVFSKAAILHNQRQQRQSCALLLLSATNHPHTPDAQRQPVNRPSRHLLWALEDYTRAASCRRQHAQAPADTKAAVT